MPDGLNVAVLGAGLMGHGLAQVFATAGAEVHIHDPSAAALATVGERVAANLEALGGDLGAVARITCEPQLPAAVAGADLVIEAGPEDLEVKRGIFADLDVLAPAEAILATNTSVLSVSEIAQGLAGAHRVLGTHWWNPPYLVPLVEVIPTPLTSPGVVTATLDILRAAGKAPVHIKREVPGGVGNRLQHAMWREAIALVAAGVCDAETLDTVVKASFGLRLSVLGPLENADLIGLDLTLAIHEYVLPHLDRTPGPSPWLTQLVAEGRLGMKTGAGCGWWSPPAAHHVRQTLSEHLMAATDSTVVVSGDTHSPEEREI